MKKNPEIIRRSFGGRSYWLVSIATSKHDADVAKATLIGTGHAVRTVRKGRSWRIFARQA